jgi:HJR/Mrr/RecB family endonuclease
MQFKDAAYHILKAAAQPLHYYEITEQALAQNLITTSGKTPHASMGALLYTDTLNPDSRFRRGEQKGTFVLKHAAPKDIQQQINTIKAHFRKELRQNLLNIPPQKFEELIRLLLVEMGFEETETTSYSNDQGVDVRGVLKANTLSTVKIAIQAKRWTNNVGSSVVRDLRGSLLFTESEQGIIITPSDFTASSKKEAQAPGKFPIALINGLELIDLLDKHKVGIQHEEYKVPYIDHDYWTEILGVTLAIEEIPIPDKIVQPPIISFPIDIQASFHGQKSSAQLLNLEGEVSYQGETYPTPTTAAKLIATTWKQVNGWDFWKYYDTESDRWIKIGELRKSKSNLQLS